MTTGTKTTYNHGERQLRSLVEKIASGNVYKILSLLLDYPNEDVKENLSGIKAVVEEESVLDKTQCDLLGQFLGPIQSITLSDWQMLYVQQFDFSRKHQRKLRMIWESSPNWPECSMWRGNSKRHLQYFSD